ncbi:exo-alpha-sialidase [Brachybacterium alimentarium]|uniref:exo-alpha-sialidase n=1 Tax=Brachybacterium alimentarium TaxID=47845 RepID=UPI003FD06B95
MPPSLTVHRRTLVDRSALGCAAVRIPAVLRCRDGRLLAFAEARYDSAGDAGRIDVVATTSLDGTAWSSPTVVVSGNGGTSGNPVPIEAGNGDIVLLSTSNARAATEAEILAGTVAPGDGRRVHVTRLTPDLTQIDQPVEITNQVKKPDWGWYATGPGHGIRLPSGRLVVAANHSRLEYPPGESPYAAHGLISDDDGHSWRIAWIADGIEGASGPNESALAPDPSSPTEALVTCRNENRDEPQTRTLARTEDDCERLGSHDLLAGFTGPRLQSGITSRVEETLVLLTSPVWADARRDLALHVLDGNACHAVGMVLQGPAGYSDLASDEESLHVLVETGEVTTHERIELVTIDLPSVLHTAGHRKELRP